MPGKRVRDLIPQFEIEGHPTLWDIVSTPWDDLSIAMRAEKHETVNQLLDIMKATYGQDATTFIWAADRLELETGMTDIISRLTFEPVNGIAARETHEKG